MAEYLLVSMTKSRHTRLQRMKAAQHHSAVQKMAGGKFLVKPSRTLQITEANLLLHLAEFKQAVADGRLQVLTVVGRRVVDLTNLQPAPLTPTLPLPNPPLDTAATDTPSGEKMRPYLTGKALDEASVIPSVIAALAKEEADEKDDDEETEETDEPDDVPLDPATLRRNTRK